MRAITTNLNIAGPANNPELIKNQAVELAALAPDVLVVGTALASLYPCGRETSTIPIVFVNVGDPVVAV